MSLIKSIKRLQKIANSTYTVDKSGICRYLDGELYPNYFIYTTTLEEYKASLIQDIVHNYKPYVYDTFYSSLPRN